MNYSVPVNDAAVCSELCECKREASLTDILMDTRTTQEQTLTALARLLCHVADPQAEPPSAKFDDSCMADTVRHNLERAQMIQNAVEQLVHIIGA